MAALDLGRHAFFILASYGIAFAVIALLIAWVVLDYRAQRRALTALEAEGITRRSVRASATGDATR